MNTFNQITEWVVLGQGRKKGYNYHCKGCSLGFNTLSHLVQHLPDCFPEATARLNNVHPKVRGPRKVKAIPAIDKVNSPVESMAVALSPASTLEFFNFMSAELTASREIQKAQESLIESQSKSIAQLHEKLESFKRIKVSNETAMLYQEYTRR